MNHYDHRHALKLILPLFVLLAGCSFPIEDKIQTTATTEAPVVSPSPTPTAVSFASTVPSAIILPSYTPTSAPTVTPTSTAIPTETMILMPTQPNPMNPSSVNQNSENIPSGDRDSGNVASAPPANENPPSIIVEVFPIVPDVPEDESKPTPTPCTICTAD